MEYLEHIRLILVIIASILTSTKLAIEIHKLVKK